MLNSTRRILQSVLTEARDLLSQLVEVGEGRITLHLDRATWRNVFSQIRTTLLNP